MIQWTITSGDVIQVLALFGAVFLYGARLESQNRVASVKQSALEKRLETNERRTDAELADIRRTLHAGFRSLRDGLDAKMDKT